MRSTRTEQPVGYLGVDPSSRYAHRPRAVDVCSLVPDARGCLQAHFWCWEWDAGGGMPAVDGILDELRRSPCVMVDGPQGLAAPGRSVRAAERLCRAAGKTPDRLPEPGDGPYGGFIRSSVELFAALHGAGVAVSPAGLIGGVNEFYPGEGWRRLAGRRLPVKTTAVGRKLRGDWLRRFGVRLPGTASHDQLDACLGALLAAAADGRVAGLEVEWVGPPLRVDRSGALREGPIALPRPTQGDGRNNAKKR